MRPGLLVFLFLCTRIALAADIRLDYTRQSLAATYHHYTQFIDGLPVIGGEVIERVDADGTVRQLHQSIARPAPYRPLVPRTQALAQVPAGVVREETLVALNIDGEARRVWRVVVEPQPYQPYAHYIDAATGVLLRSDPLFVRARGRVFDPNPVAKLNAPQLRDQNDSASAVPEAAYTEVDLPDLPSAGMLIGPNVQIVDTQKPFTVHADASQSLMFDRSQPQFEEVNAYFHIDRAQRYLQSLGYVGARRIVGYSIPVDPHAADGADNSFYTSSSIPGQGALYFGDGGTDDAEDSDILLHEFAHAIQDWIAPGAFFGPSSSQGRALGEGYGDYWGFSSTYAGTIASGRDPYCLADWDARCEGDSDSSNCDYPPGSDCLRRMDSTKTMSDFILQNQSGTEHLNGTIWASALREIFDSLTQKYGLDAGRRRSDTLVIESMFGAPLNPTYALVAKKLLDADRVLDQSADAGVICSAMTKRGILTGADCDIAPRGDLTYYQSPQQGLAIPDDPTQPIMATVTIDDSRSIDQLFVNVDIEHPSRGDLQILLTAPDGTHVVLQDSSQNHSATFPVSYGITTQSTEPLSAFHGRPAAGTWTLSVRDVRSPSAGTLRSWSLVITFVGESPATARPFAFGGRKHIPAVAHTTDATGTPLKSDVRIFNRGTSLANVTAVFTPRDADGWQRFAAVKLVIESGRIVALDDVVSSLMQSAGMGQLELLGDVGNLVVTSRTSAVTSVGSYGEDIPSFDSADAIASGSTATIAPLENSSAFRSNIGLAEVGGQTGTIRFSFFDGSGAALGAVEYTVHPFSQFQGPLPVAGTRLRAEVSIISGNPRVLAYGSVVDSVSGDAMFVAAAAPATADRELVLPAIRADGRGGAVWRTDVHVTNAVGPTATFSMETAAARSFSPTVAGGAMLYFGDVLATQFGLVRSLSSLFASLPPAVLVTSRTWTPCGAGTCGQFVPNLNSRPGGVEGGLAKDVIGIEESERFRTNLGVVNSNSEPVQLRLTAYDSWGRPLGSLDRIVPPRDVVQVPLTLIIGDRLMNGRVHLDLTDAQTKHVYLYGSLIDNLSGDPTFLAAH